MKPKAILSWSSGKDSAWTLHRLRTRGDSKVVALVTTYNEAFDRVAMHGVRLQLVEAQARAVDLPLWRIPLPWPCPNAVYEQQMRGVVERARSEGITHFAFGDLFLEDIRAYREKQLAGTGLEPIFPLWGPSSNTAALAREMITSGLRAVLTCIDPTRIPRPFAGRTFDGEFLTDLPANVDPCGERGEFHTFCEAGPMFERPLAVRAGESVERDGFLFVDLLEDV
jgi:uncharacterized protein (TIGR00290 family)